MQYWIAAGLTLWTISAQAENGVASVFYDRVVACKGRINPYATWGAAHKTLPCGTMVEVTNRLNGRKITVPIIDKGPCTTTRCLTQMPPRVRKRIFDMLPPVAKAIGSTGLTPVTVNVVSVR